MVLYQVNYDHMVNIDTSCYFKNVFSSKLAKKNIVKFGCNNYNKFDAFCAILDDLNVDFTTLVYDSIIVSVTFSMKEELLESVVNKRFKHKDKFYNSDYKVMVEFIMKHFKLKNSSVIDDVTSMFLLK